MRIGEQAGLGHGLGGAPVAGKTLAWPFWSVSSILSRLSGLVEPGVVAEKLSP